MTLFWLLAQENCSIFLLVYVGSLSLTHTHTHTHTLKLRYTFSSTYSAKHRSSSIRFVHSLIKKYWLTSDFLSKHHLYWECMQVGPLYSCSPSERRTPPPPQTLSWPYNWWSAAGGKQIENQCGWHRRNENEAFGGVGVGGGLQTSQGKQWRVRTLQRKGNLVPAVFQQPPHTLFIVHQWAGINSFNLELNVLTLACLAHTWPLTFSSLVHTPSVYRCSHWPLLSHVQCRGNTWEEQGLIVYEMFITPGCSRISDKLIPTNPLWGTHNTSSISEKGLKSCLRPLKEKRKKKRKLEARIGFCDWGWASRPEPHTHSSDDDYNIVSCYILKIYAPPYIDLWYVWDWYPIHKQQHPLTHHESALILPIV